MSKNFPNSYALIDSGSEWKLEQFGSVRIIRPCKTAIWKARYPSEWQTYSAKYFPDSGWAFQGQKFETWEFEDTSRRMLMRLQSNGQVGLFPEHYNYGNLIVEAITRLKSRHQRPLRILNLFGFTGYFTLLAAEQGAQVTHVDISKPALQWCSENLALNNLSQAEVKLIPEDGLKFVERELRRQSRYDLIIADPPSFSRQKKGQPWEIEGIISELIANCIQLMESSESLAIFTCHHSAIDSTVLSNLVSDCLIGQEYWWHKAELFVAEQASDRRLPCGSFVAFSRDLLTKSHYINFLPRA